MFSAQQQAKIVEEILILNLSKNAIKFKGKYIYVYISHKNNVLSWLSPQHPNGYSHNGHNSPAILA